LSKKSSGSGPKEGKGGKVGKGGVPRKSPFLTNCRRVGAPRKRRERLKWAEGLIIHLGKKLSRKGEGLVSESREGKGDQGKARGGSLCRGGEKENPFPFIFREKKNVYSGKKRAVLL